MKKKYIKFIVPDDPKDLSMYDFLKYLNENYMQHEASFPEVSEWLIEFSELGLPLREIVFFKGEAILKAPYNNTPAFWSKTQLKENYLKMFFNTSVMSETFFQENWESVQRIIPDFQIEVKNFRYILNMDDEDNYSYLKTIIRFKNKRRILRIYFSDENEENTISEHNFFSYTELRIRGELNNYGIDEDLYLLKSELLNNV